MRQYLIRQTGYPWDTDVINLHALLGSLSSWVQWWRTRGCPWKNHVNGTTLNSYYSRLENTLILIQKKGLSQITMRKMDNFAWKWFSRRSVGGAGPSYKDAEDNSMPPLGDSSLLVRIHYTQLSQESIHLRFYDSTVRVENRLPSGHTLVVSRAPLVPTGCHTPR